MADHLQYPCEDHEARLQRHTASLAALEVQMKDLMGNGQPGRIATIEKQIMSQQKTLWIGVGILSALQVLHANGMLNLGNLFRASQTQDQPAAIHQVVK